MGRTVTVQWVKGMKVEGAVGPHRLVMDAPAEAGGGDEAPEGGAPQQPHFHPDDDGHDGHGHDGHGHGHHHGSGHGSHAHAH